MRILLTGATGMVGQGALRECLLDPEVSEVLAIGRSPMPQRHPKLRELIVPDLGNLTGHEGELAGFDACLFCAGISSAGLSEEKYTQITHDLTLSFARTLFRISPAISFLYVTGAGTDSSEKGRVMWARVKGRTENALFRIGFKNTYMFRPGFIQPLHGIRSKTPVYQFFYSLTRPLTPLLRAVLGRYATDTEQLGRAMLFVAKSGFPRPILEGNDINSIRQN